MNTIIDMKIWMFLLSINLQVKLFVISFANFDFYHFYLWKDIEFTFYRLLVKKLYFQIIIKINDIR